MRLWFLTRGGHLQEVPTKAMTGKILVFWINSRLWEVVAYKRFSHMEVRLYLWFAIISSVQLLQTVDKFYVKNPRVLDITGMYDYF